MKIMYSFLYSQICKDLTSMVSANHRNNIQFALIKLFLACESGQFFSTKKELVSRLDIGEKIGGILWDYCIEHKIIKNTDYGYTAMPYLLTNRMSTTEKKEEDDVEFVYAKLELYDLGISRNAIKVIREVYDQRDFLAIAGMYYLRNWMTSKQKKGLLVDNFDSFKALTTWVYKTVSGKDFDRFTFFNKISSIDQRKTLDEFSDDEKKGVPNLVLINSDVGVTLG